jgi:hypothetical protein
MQDAATHQPASGDGFAIAITSRDTLARRHGSKLRAATAKKRVRRYKY